MHRLENISLTAQDSTEFWHVREVFETVSKATNDDSFLSPVLTNTEDELYVHKSTAVWSRGIPLDNDSVPFKAYSIDSPIKFAFFCPRHFLRQTPKFRRFDETNEKKSSFYLNQRPPEDDRQRPQGICLVDSTSIKTYLHNGEDFLASLEFPVADIWPVQCCVLFERDATTTTIETRSIAMPRLFSLRHPLEEMSPVLIKYADHLGYFSNNEHKIIFSHESLDLLLMYDLKCGRHFVAQLRKATEDEIGYVGESSEQNSELFGGGNATTSHLIPPGTSFHHQQQHSMRNASRFHTSGVWNPGKTFHSTTTTGHHGGTPQVVNKSTARVLSPLVTSTNISKAMQSPLTRLQSSMRHTSFSMQDARNFGQAEPSKPIYPEFCLESVWMEEIQVERLLEPASRGFYHTDWMGQKYLCYLLPRQGRLYLVEMGNAKEKNKKKGTLFSATGFIETKEAISLDVSWKFV